MHCLPSMTWSLPYVVLGVPSSHLVCKSLSYQTYLALSYLICSGEITPSSRHKMHPTKATILPNKGRGMISPTKSFCHVMILSQGYLHALYRHEHKGFSLISFHHERYAMLEPHSGDTFWRDAIIKEPQHADTVRWSVSVTPTVAARATWKDIVCGHRVENGWYIKLIFVGRNGGDPQAVAATSCSLNMAIVTNHNK